MARGTPQQVVVAFPSTFDRMPPMLFVPGHSRLRRLFPAIMLGGFATFPYTVSAQTIGLTVGDSARVEVAPGGKLTVPLRGELGNAGGTTLSAVQGRLSWSSSRLTLDSIRAISGWTLTANQDSVAFGRLVFSTFGTAVLPTSGPVATAYFTASATSGGTRITFTPVAAGDEAGNSVLPRLQVRGQDVCVGIPGKWGDVTEDGLVNVLDAQQIARSSVGLSVVRPAALSARGDVSADGTINIIDAQQIARFGVGLSAAARVNTAIFAPPTVSFLAITFGGTAALIPGNVIQLNAEPFDASSVAGCPSITWSSSNPAVASVNGNGQVTLLAPGTVVVTASVGGKSMSEILIVESLPLAGATIASGIHHSCALSPAGRAFCWGYNNDGQLGNGTTVPRAEPGPVSTDLAFVSLSAGEHHTCGLTTARVIFCWGAGWNGRLGDGTTSNRLVPTRINSPLTFTRVAAGRQSTCALADGGAAYCWGLNYGQLGDGSTTERSSPVPVQGGLTFTSIEVGWRHACAVTSSNAGYCWGNNDDGYLGDGTRTTRLMPALVSGGLAFSEISAGQIHTCGRTTSGAAFCWGNYSRGSLGNGTTSTYYAPTPVSGGQQWRSIRVGHEVTCGITTSQALLCWGRNDYGQVGDGTRTDRTVPTPVMTGVSAVAVGWEGSACALATGGAAHCWGLDYDGAAGRGFQRILTPTAVSGAPALVALTSNFNAQSMCGLSSTGAVTCWGRNGWDAFGTTAAPPINDAPIAGVNLSLRSIAGGGYHTCGVTAANVGYCWGANWYGTHGSGNTNWTGNTPVAVTGGLAFSKIESGNDQSCGLTTAGQVYCWGLATNGRLGEGSTSGNVLTPTLVSGSLTFTDIATGSSFSCGVATGGAAYCWGANWSGQLGDGTTTSRSTPVPVSGGFTFSRVETGGDFACGLLTDGRVACWGAGASGRLGNGSTTNRTTPTLISSSLTFTRLDVLTERACALTTAGELFCWGLNNRSQLGTGNTVDAWTPVRIGGTRTFTAVAGSNVTTCAIGTDTQSYCWGDNAWGQAGQRQTITPQPVLGGLTFRTP